MMFDVFIHGFISKQYEILLDNILELSIDKI